MSERIHENTKTIRVTATNGVTGRLWFNDFDGNTGIIGVTAKHIEVFNADDPILGNSARVQINLLDGNIAVDDARTIRPNESQSRDVKAYCIAYEGIGVDVELEITIEW